MRSQIHEHIRRSYSRVRYRSRSCSPNVYYAEWNSMISNTLRFSNVLCQIKMERLDRRTLTNFDADFFVFDKPRQIVAHVFHSFFDSLFMDSHVANCTAIFFPSFINHFYLIEFPNGSSQFYTDYLVVLKWQWKFHKKIKLNYVESLTPITRTLLVQSSWCIHKRLIRCNARWLMRT